MKFYFLFYFFTLFNICYAESGGGSVGNGSDDTDIINKVAWFTMFNTRDSVEPEIDYCIMKDDSFPQSENELMKLIENAYDQWNKYRYLDPSGNLSYSEGLNLTRLVMKLKKVPCTGNESLTFYFGVDNDIIKERKKRYIDPIAFAHRLQIKGNIDEVKATWSKGYIWFAKSGSTKPGLNYPNWSNQDHLYSILLHEIGHTLGNPHVPGTVMSEKLSDLMWKPEYKNFDPKKYFRQINITRELFNHYEGNTVYQGEILPNNFFNAQERSNNIFNALTGDTATNPITATVYFDLGVTSTGERTSDGDVIEIHHSGSINYQSGDKKYSINYVMNSPSESDMVHVADVFLSWNGSNKISYSECVNHVLYGEATLPSGEKKTLIMERGMHDNVITADEFLNSNVTFYILGLGGDFSYKQQIFYVNPVIRN